MHSLFPLLINLSYNHIKNAAIPIISLVLMSPVQFFHGHLQTRQLSQDGRAGLVLGGEIFMFHPIDSLLSIMDGLGLLSEHTQSYGGHLHSSLVEQLTTIKQLTF